MPSQGFFVVLPQTAVVLVLKILLYRQNILLKWMDINKNIGKSNFQTEMEYIKSQTLLIPKFKQDSPSYSYSQSTLPPSPKYV
jgi:hypothetical protein